MFFNLTNRDGQTTLSVISTEANYEKVLPSTHPNFDAVLEYLTHNTTHDEEYVRGLVDPTVGIAKAMAEVSDRVTADLYTLYFDGQPVSGLLAQHVLDMLRGRDTNWDRLVRFMINLDDNPSYQAQQAVYRWVEQNGLTITEDGSFIGYKGVQSDGLSKSRGPNNYIDGKLLGKAGVAYQVPHEIGTVISKKRADVDDDSRLACSVGLHVGTKQYATGFGERLLTVKINPADVVSIPDNHLEYKIRVCKYEVLELANDASFEHTSYDPEPEPEPEPTTEPEPETTQVWHVVEYDNLGTTILETFDSEEVAYEAYQGWVDTPGAEYGAYGVEQSEEYKAVEPEEGSKSDDGDLLGKTLPELAEMIPELRADLHNSDLGHIPLARKWSKFTSETSVRRYRKRNGI